MRLVILAPDQILPPLVPAREAMDAEAFRELVADVREHGVRQPVRVIPVEGGYRLVAGQLARCTHDADRKFLLTHAISGGATADTVRRWVTQAALERERTPAAAIAAGQVVEVTTPAVPMAECDWGRHKVPLNATLSFNVCGDHYTFLRRLRDQVEAEAAAAPND